MITFRKLAVATALGGVAALGAPASVQAQTTDGYHTIQVIPIVVDSASFTQRFSFQNPNVIHTATVAVTYVPADGTSQTTPLSCPSFVIPADQGFTVFTSLRQICPALPAGSQFGYLYLSEASGANHPFSAYSRVSNIQGQGFSVEGFPAHTFTSADAVVTGLRRMAATATSPAYQTNCFFGNMHDLSPDTPAATSNLAIQIVDTQGVFLSSFEINLVPGRLVRLLDIFEASGAAPGDYADAALHVYESGPTEAALMAFCTVQDNSSFGADFRIGKQEQGNGSTNEAIGAQDDHVRRDATVDSDVLMPGSFTARPFTIPAGASSNTHVMYFRHPDYVQCEIIDPATNVRALPGYGLEMRMVADDGFTVLAGGNNATGFGEIYLGDKADRNNGANTRYTIAVESSETNTGAARPYKLRCQSGSGHSAGDIIRYQEAVDRF